MRGKRITSTESACNRGGTNGKEITARKGGRRDESNFFR